MRILLVHNRYRMRTGEDIAFDFTKTLLERDGHELILYTEDNRSIEEFGFTDKLLLPARSIYSTKSKKSICDFVEREKPDVAIVQNVFPLLSPSIYYGLAERNIPIVQIVFNYRLLCANGQFFTQGKICERCLGGSYVHGLVHRCYRDSFFLSAINSAGLAVHRMAETWSKCIGTFVVPDEFLGRKLVQGNLPESRMRTIPNPFDIDSCSPSKQPGEYALFIGLLSRQKGVLTLLDAAARCSGAKVVIVGDGPEKEVVLGHPAVLSGRASFLGPVYGRQMIDLLANCAFVVVPSEWYDNLPMIVCQAFASARPVIASRINGIPEYVKHEENGLLFSPSNAEELASAMERLWADPALRARLSCRARRTAEEVFHPDRWIGRMNAVLGEAVRGQPV